MHRFGIIALLGLAVAPANAQEAWRTDYERALDLFTERKLEQAIQLLDEALARHPRIAQLFYLRGFCKRSAGDLAGALRDADAAVAQDPTYADALVERGYIKACQLDFKAAIADYDRAIELDPKHAMAFGDRGDAWRSLGEMERARDDYDRALAIQPDYGAALHNRAHANMGLGAYKAAIRDQTRALVLCPPQPAMWTTLAFAQERLGRWDAAITSATQGLQHFVDDVDLLLVLARVQWRRGDGNATMKSLERAIGANTAKTPAASRQRLACYCLAMGQRTQARTLFDVGLTDPVVRPWAALMIWCTFADNATADRWLQQEIAAWPETAAEHSGGELTRSLAATALGAAAAPPDHAHPDFACPAWFLCGWRHQRDGRSEAARRCFAAAVNTGRFDFMQWDLALWQLECEQRPAATLGCEVQARPDGQLEVTKVDESGPAQRQGLRVGDRITRINDKEASSVAFSRATRALVVGTPIRLVLAREGGSAVRWVTAGISER